MRRAQGSGRLAGFARETDGAATVEFVIIFPVVMAMIFSFFEAGWLMTRSMMLDRGLDLAVREVRIGAADHFTHAEFKTLICAHSLVFREGCEASVVVEMIPVASPADLPDRNAVCVDRTTDIAPTVRYDPGARSEIVFIRACMMIDPLTPGLGLAMHLPRDASGGVALVSYSAFVNEPE